MSFLPSIVRAIVRQAHREERGSALVMMTAALMVLLVFAALAVDVSFAHLERRRMQNAVDSVVVAGTLATALGQNSAQIDAEVNNLASANGAYTVTWSYVNGITGVQATVSRDVNTYFAGVIGWNSFTTGATAAAIAAPVVAADDILPIGISDCDCVTFDQEQTFDGVPPTVATLAFGDAQNTIIEIRLDSHVGNTWTYVVQEINGRDLSHWSLGISSCLSRIASYSPTQRAEIGVDGSTGFTGIKWETQNNFSVGSFSITMDADYPVGLVPVLVKSTPDSVIAHIAGPVCDGSADCVFTWLDWNGSPAILGELESSLINTGHSGVQSVGSWISTGPKIQGGMSVNSALNSWLDQPATVILYDDITNDLSQVHACGFGRFTLRDYDLSGYPKWIRGEFQQSVIPSVTVDQNANDYGVRDIIYIQ